MALPAMLLEIQSKRELNLAAGAQAHITNYGLAQQPERSARGSLSVRLARLHYISAGAERVKTAGESELLAAPDSSASPVRRSSCG